MSLTTLNPAFQIQTCPHKKDIASHTCNHHLLMCNSISIALMDWDTFRGVSRVEMMRKGMEFYNIITVK